MEMKKMKEMEDMELTPTSYTAGIVRPVDGEKPLKSDEDLKKLKIRRTLERELFRKFDKTKINPRKECWFLIDSKWINDWSAFIEGAEGYEDGPGKISSKDLLDNEGKPLEGLKARIDYRAIPPISFYMFVDLHGRDKSPDICRYTVDIYSKPVPPEKLVNIQYGSKREAQIQVAKIRPEWVSWEREYEDDDDDVTSNNVCCCGWITKQHIEAIIYWAVMCWSRKKSGRKGIKYSNYKPLSNVSEHGFSNHGSSHGSSHGNDVNNPLHKGEETADEKAKRLIHNSDFDSSGFADSKGEKGTWLKKFTGFG